MVGARPPDGPRSRPARAARGTALRLSAYDEGVSLWHPIDPKGTVADPPVDRRETARGTHYFQTDPPIGSRSCRTSPEGARTRPAKSGSTKKVAVSRRTHCPALRRPGSPPAALP